MTDGQTDRQTDGRTGGRTDKVITIGLRRLRLAGPKMTIMTMIVIGMVGFDSFDRA